MSTGLVIFRKPIIMRGFLRFVGESLSEKDRDYFLEEAEQAIRSNNGSDFVKKLIDKRKKCLQSYRFDYRGSSTKAYRVEYNGFDVLIWDEEAKEFGIQIPDELFEL